jgi:hypothetical protein
MAFEERGVAWRLLQESDLISVRIFARACEQIIITISQPSDECEEHHFTDFIVEIRRSESVGFEVPVGNV